MVCQYQYEMNDISARFDQVKDEVDREVPEIAANSELINDVITKALENESSIANVSEVAHVTATELESLETDVQTNTNAITVLQAGGGGSSSEIEKLDVTTHDSKNIASNGDYEPSNISWGSSSSPVTIPWGANPTSLTVLARKSGAMYLPDPDSVNLEIGQVVTVVFAPRIGQNCSLAVFVHDDDKAMITYYNNVHAKTNFHLHENRTARFVYLGQYMDRPTSNFYDRHRWLLEVND